MLIAALFTCKQLKCPLRDKWVKKMWCVCVCIYIYIYMQWNITYP